MRYTSRIILILLMLQLVLFPKLAQARVAEGQFQISPVIGIALPLGTLRDQQGPGYTVGLSIDYMVSDRVALGADLSGAHFAGYSQMQVYVWDGWGDPDTIRTAFASSLAQYPNPFLDLGLGEAMFSSAQVVRQVGGSYRYEDLRTRLAFRFGTGCDLRISQFASGLASASYVTGAVHFLTVRFALAFQFRPL